MYTSLSAVQKDSVSAFLKTLAIIYVSYDVALSREQLRTLTLWQKQAHEFIKLFKLEGKVDPVVRMLLQGKDPAKYDPLDDAVCDLMDALKEKHSMFDKETDIGRPQLGLMKDFRLSHYGSEAASRRILRGVAAIGDPAVTKFFTHDVDGVDTGTLYQKLQKLVAKHGGGAKGYIMPTPVLEEWQAYNKAQGKKREAHTQYLALRKEVNDLFKKTLANMVRASGKPYLPLRDVISNLNAQGVVHNLPAGFVGNIDDVGRFYTTAGKRLLQTPSGEVRMNGKYDANEDNAYVCEFTPAFALKASRAYTENFRTTSKRDKFEVVMETLPKLPKLSKKWLPHIRLRDSKKEGVLATLCEFIYETSARVGNKNAKTAGEKTFAATQLLVKHFKFNASNGCTVKYQGKASGLQVHKIRFASARARQLGDALRYFADGKGPNDLMFTFRDMPVTGNAINKYLQSLGFHPKFTIHKLRTARGTSMAMTILANHPFKKGSNFKERDVHKWLETELLNIGSELGHMSGANITSNTAIQNYIAPELLASFYAGIGIRPSAKVQKAIDSVSKEM